jgi:hypothetical protein
MWAAVTPKTWYQTPLASGSELRTSFHSTGFGTGRSSVSSEARKGSCATGGGLGFVLAHHRAARPRPERSRTKQAGQAENRCGSELVADPREQRDERAKDDREIEETPEASGIGTGAW